MKLSPSPAHDRIATEYALAWALSDPAAERDWRNVAPRCRMDRRFGWLFNEAYGAARGAGIPELSPDLVPGSRVRVDWGAHAGRTGRITALRLWGFSHGWSAQLDNGPWVFVEQLSRPS